MKSNRVGLTLIYEGKKEVEKGVFEDFRTNKTVKATKQKVFQTRIDALSLQGIKINGRFEVNEQYDSKDLKYITFKGDTYKIREKVEDKDKHLIVIEAGELV
ncbi:phage head-tail adapter protein [Carnobacterium divergens]|uniref:Phage head-tail adapter protein n=1 Tax=Carnobacterium divergens TaxID=2748 RepID=A0AAW8RBJ8_CARDV|nr:phage head-tail adapter protein [Carnobacterium divergens]MDT1959030.1 phage head-tail adapter protein [Carnobacterium divergens]MDT1975139.1 phage head-tail adapter protein [Carnobacterium divergens]